VHPGVNSRFSPEATLIFRKNARGWGGISESPPWGRNEPTGSSGPLGSPHQVRARMPCDHGTHLPRVSGSSELTTDVIQIAPTPGRAVYPMAAASGRPGPTGPPGGYCHPVPAVGVSLSGYSIKLLTSTSNGRKSSRSAPAPVAEIARLQVVSAAPHAYPPAGTYVRLALTLHGIRSGTLFLAPETLRSCIARKSRQTIQKKPRSARGEGRCERCSTIDLSKRPPVFSSLTRSERRAAHCDGEHANVRTQAPTKSHAMRTRPLPVVALEVR
jgi:hypothetical protein